MLLPTNLHTHTKIDSFEFSKKTCTSISSSAVLQKKKKCKVYFIEFQGQDLMHKWGNMQMTNRK